MAILDAPSISARTRYKPLPNPLNASTSVHITLDSQQHIRLELYNLLGRRVVSLYNGVAAKGQQTFTLDGRSLSSGVCFLRRHSEDHGDAMQRITLVR